MILCMIKLVLFKILHILFKVFDYILQRQPKFNSILGVSIYPLFMLLHPKPNIFKLGNAAEDKES